METLINGVNKLQDAFSSAKIPCRFDLPQIVLVGEQSSGKSSVLERIVGRDFLPKGPGIVTLRPLILQLVNRDGPEYGVFYHNKGRKYTDFDEIRKEIELETDRVTNKSKKISWSPINLRIYSPNVMTLTLIDLPGVTKIAFGEQPDDICTKTREMVKKAISNPNCIILAVIPGVTDVYNSEALKLSQEVDPNRIRTIGVVTKIDMMNDVKNCFNVLTNKAYPLARGFVGVVNTSQKDIVQNKDMATAKADETKFFEEHPVYRSLGDRVGSGFLQKTLIEILAVHIKKILPKIKQSIMEQLAVIKTIIDDNPALNLDTDCTDTFPHEFLILLIQELVEYINSRLGYSEKSVDLDELSCGYKISSTLLSRFFLEVEKIRPLPETLRREIYIAVCNMSGVKDTKLCCRAAFIAVTKQHIQFIKSPCITVLEIVHGLLTQLLKEATEKILSPYPELQSLIYVCLQEKLFEFYNESKDYIELLVKVQVDHINTNHPDFMAFHDSIQDNGVDNCLKRDITNPEKVIYHEGHITILNIASLKSPREFYSILKGQTLYVYKNSLKNQLKKTFVLKDCMMKDLTRMNKFQLVITHTTKRSMHKSSRTLELGLKTIDELEGWKAAFVGCGVELELSDEISNTDEFVIDSEMQKDIEHIYLSVVSYLRITVKTMQDLIGKVITYSMIIKLKEDLFSHLLIALTQIENIDEYIQESDGIKSERQRICAISKSCRDVLELIEKFQKDYHSDFKNHRKLSFASTPKNINESELKKHGTITDITKLNHAMSRDSICDESIESSPLSKSPTVQKSTEHTGDQNKINKPKKPPPKPKS